MWAKSRNGWLSWPGIASPFGSVNWSHRNVKRLWNLWYILWINSWCYCFTHESHTVTLRPGFVRRFLRPFSSKRHPAGCRAASGIAERSGAEKEAKKHFSSQPPAPPCLRICPFSLAQRKERKETSTLPKAPPVYGGGAIDSGQRPPYIKDLVWLTKPVPLRGEPWFFDGWRVETTM